MLQEKRATRGLRMSVLVGEAADEDNQFYSNDLWEEDESDDSYEAEEIKPDVFDSDFNDTEDEESSDDEDENNARRNDKNEVFSSFYGI